MWNNIGIITSRVEEVNSIVDVEFHNVDGQRFDPDIAVSYLFFAAPSKLLIIMDTQWARSATTLWLLLHHLAMMEM